jgi:hypothetical protein
MSWLCDKSVLVPLGQWSSSSLVLEQKPVYCICFAITHADEWAPSLTCLSTQISSRGIHTWHSYTIPHLIKGCQAGETGCKRAYTHPGALYLRQPRVRLAWYGTWARLRLVLRFPTHRKGDFARVTCRPGMSCAPCSR